MALIYAISPSVTRSIVLDRYDTGSQSLPEDPLSNVFGLVH